MFAKRIAFTQLQLLALHHVIFLNVDKFCASSVVFSASYVMAILQCNYSLSLCRTCSCRKSK